MKKFPCAVLATAILFSSFGHGANTPTQPLLLNSPPPTMSPKPDFAAIENVNEKKKKFVAFMKPGIEYLNEEMEKNRMRLITLSSVEPLTEKDAAYLEEIATFFRLPLPEKGANKTWFNDILNRVDTIPVDLALTQSAKESGWGTSRFSREFNNYYGQWCFTSGCGVVPLKRPEGQTYEVASFKGPFESSAAYFTNINTGNPYAKVREIRAKLRAEGKEVTGEALADGLIKYSQLGQVYIDQVKSMMKYNAKVWAK